MREWRPSGIPLLPGLLVGPMAPVRLVTREEPRVRHTGWARVKPSLSGICGSDLGVITGTTSLYFAALAWTREATFNRNALSAMNPVASF